MSNTGRKVNIKVYLRCTLHVTKLDISSWFLIGCSWNLHGRAVPIHYHITRVEDDGRKTARIPDFPCIIFCTAGLLTTVGQSTLLTA